MDSMTCLKIICFSPLEDSSPKFFGFSELLAGLALMVLAWTIADVRYQFRIKCAPLPLMKVTYFTVFVIGLLTLLTDLWRADRLPVPEGHLITVGLWQALLGTAFLLTFLCWSWFAFILPPKFGRFNAKRYAQALYGIILKGSEVELSIIADEFSKSAFPIIKYATNRPQSFELNNSINNPKPSECVLYANDLLLLIADKRFCNAIVNYAPGTALSIFSSIQELGKYRVQVEIFSKNFFNAAINNRNSFIYHETNEYNSGLLGHHKPLSHSMFSNYHMVESIGTLLYPDIQLGSSWDSEQWNAYFRAVSITMDSYIRDRYAGHSFTLYRAIGYTEFAVADLYMLNETQGVWKQDSYLKLRCVIDFILKTITALNHSDFLPSYKTKTKITATLSEQNIYDHIANAIFEIIFCASSVTSSSWECWSVQHNSIWSRIFNDYHIQGKAVHIVRFKVRRLIYDEISELKKFANFKGAKILKFCLNVLGITISQSKNNKDIRALHKVVISWLIKNYHELYEFNSNVANSCLPYNFTYNKEEHTLVHSFPAQGLRREPVYEYLRLTGSISTAYDSDNT